MSARTSNGITAAILVLAIALAVVLGAAACGSSGVSADSSPSGGPVKGGTLTVSWQGDPPTLDPAVAWGEDSWSIERVTYQTFLTYASKAGEAGTQLVPDLATEVPSIENGGISADGKVYTFHLKKGIKFAPPVDRELVAQDFKYGFERMLTTPLAPATFFYTNVTGAQDFMDGKASEVKGFNAVDDYTVEITLEEPESDFLNVMTMPFTSAMPKEWVDKWGKKVAQHPLGTGPYVVQKWTPGQEIVAVKNPNWTQEGRQYLDQMKFEISVNASTAVLRLKRGEIDVLGNTMPAADYISTKQDPTWSKYIVTAPSIWSVYMFMNNLEKPLDDVKVRQAISYAIDTARLAKVTGGQSVPLNQVFPAGLPGHEVDKVFYTYDPAKAKQLLTEAGYPDGFTTTVYCQNVDPYPKVVQSIQADLKDVGIAADIKLMDRGTYWDFISLKKSHVPMGIADWGMDFPDPSDFIGPLYTHPADGGVNDAFYQNAQVDKLYTDSNSEFDTAKRIGMFQEMQDIIMSDAPTAQLYQIVRTGMSGKTTGGYYIHPVYQLVYQDYWKTDGK